MSIEFFMSMVPPTVTAQEHKITVKNNKPIFYDPPILKNARKKLMANLMPHVPEIPLHGALELVVSWLFQRINQNEVFGQMKIDGAGGIVNGLEYEWRITKPDTDNLNKLLKDCMTSCGFWEDDAQVCREIIEKYNVNQKPGIWIRITELK